MELEVGEDQVIDSCAFTSSDKVIKVNGCNFALDYNPNFEKKDGPNPTGESIQKLKHMDSLSTSGMCSQGVDQCAVIATVPIRHNIRTSASVGFHDLKGDFQNRSQEL